VNEEELLADGGRGLTRLFEQVRCPALHCASLQLRCLQAGPCSLPTRHWLVCPALLAWLDSPPGSPAACAGRRFCGKPHLPAQSADPCPPLCLPACLLVVHLTAESGAGAAG
jgi:hypothetical protein